MMNEWSRQVYMYAGFMAGQREVVHDTSHQRGWSVDFTFHRTVSEPNTPTAAARRFTIPRHSPRINNHQDWPVFNELVG